MGHVSLTFWCATTKALLTRSILQISRYLLADQSIIPSESTLCHYSFAFFLDAEKVQRCPARSHTWSIAVSLDSMTLQTSGLGPRLSHPMGGARRYHKINPFCFISSRSILEGNCLILMATIFLLSFSQQMFRKKREPFKGQQTEHWSRSGREW